MAKAGYEYLLVYKIAVPVYDYTVEFCTRCSPYHPNHPDHPNFPYLSSTRTHDQMTQAARSGMTNIAEGAKQNSLAGYIKLAGVTRGSLEELLKDFLAYARAARDTDMGKIQLFPIPPISPISPINPRLP